MSMNEQKSKYFDKFKQFKGGLFMDKFYTATELTDKLQLTRQTIYNLVKRGELPKGRKIGGSRRWSETELENFIKGGE